MKFFIFAIILLPSTLAAIHCSRFIFEAVISTLLSNPPREHEVNAKDVRFFLYTRNNPDKGIELHEGTYQQINSHDAIKVIIHGYVQNSTMEWEQNMTRELLKQKSYNVIRVDYAKIALEKYLTTAGSVKAIGKLVGKLIVTLNSSSNGIPLSRYHIIGHSLGAHVAGIAGNEVIKLTRLKIPRITALDAAGPYFDCFPVYKKQALKKSDAYLVDAIHTDIINYGYGKAFAHADFYPNGGISPQPGCPALLQTISDFFINQQEHGHCSHHRSYLYFVSSINVGKFVSTKCNSWRNYTSGGCNNNTMALMGNPYGSLYAPVELGKFYLRTTPNFPYAEELY